MARCSCLEMRGVSRVDPPPHPVDGDDDDHTKPADLMSFDEPGDLHPNEPPQLYEGGGYMVRFSEPQAGKDLSVEELKCPSDENQEASAIGYIFPQGLHNFALTFEDHEHIRIREQAFRVKQTGRLADSLRFLYSSMAGDGRKAPPEDAAALLQHIAKALCTMVENDIKNDPDYYLLRGVPFMKLNLYEGGSGQPPKRAVIVGISRRSPSLPHLSGAVEVRNLTVFYKKGPEVPEKYQVPHEGYYAKFAIRDKRLRLKTLYCPGRPPVRKFEDDTYCSSCCCQLAVIGRYQVPTGTEGFALLKEVDAMEVVFTGDAEPDMDRVVYAVKWVYAGLPYPTDSEVDKLEREAKWPKEVNANALFIQMLCRTPLASTGSDRRRGGSKKGDLEQGSLL
ncbi:hypothetical protein FOZ61_009352 [Perkinsus olseni]|uniref:Uncharacterized protein n=1 Tax=Perkinsus olseni TaxID=32597 RepID=A0A7J6L291_PEROL|nr:hypothetical protein FOZ61_009352 [Perkinsus olseni]